MVGERPALAQIDQLLRAADEILSGRTHIPARQQARAGALLARTALELILDLRLTAAGFDVSTANTRTKLITLRVAVDPGSGPTVDLTYAGLSAACHQHAYELTPAAASVHLLLKTVKDQARAILHVEVAHD